MENGNTSRIILWLNDTVIAKKPLDGKTYLFVADSVTGYIKVLVKGHPGEGYNIGTETPEISMRDLAQKIATISKELFGYSGKVITKSSSDSDYLIDNPNRRCPVIEKARTHLNFNPSIALEEGLRTADLGGEATTEDATDAILRFL